MRPNYKYESIYPVTHVLTRVDDKTIVPIGVDANVEELFHKASGIFREFDKDHNGQLDPAEFKRALSKLDYYLYVLWRPKSHILAHRLAINAILLVSSSR